MEKTYGRRGASTIDPMFFIPDGVDELVYDEEGFFDEDETLDTSIDNGEGVEENKIPVPIIKEIIQTIRTTNAGFDVVDVVVVVEDIDGIKEYEVRVAKV